MCGVVVSLNLRTVQRGVLHRKARVDGRDAFCMPVVTITATPRHSCWGSHILIGVVQIRISMKSFELCFWKSQKLKFNQKP
jgi:hypothetical protein